MLRKLVVGWKVFEAAGFEPVFPQKDDAIGYAKFRSRSHDAVIGVYDEAGNVIETHEHAGRFQRVVALCLARHWDRATVSMASGCRASTAPSEHRPC